MSRSTFAPGRRLTAGMSRVILSAAQGNQLFVPEGFAHGFCTLEPDTEVVYKVNRYYSREHDFGLAWDDRDLAIAWPVPRDRALLSDKDRRQPVADRTAGPFPLRIARSDDEGSRARRRRAGRTRVVPPFLARRYEAARVSTASAWTSRAVRPCLPTIARERPDIVVNAAAYTAVDRAESEPEAAWAANCTGPGQYRGGVPRIRHSADPYLDRLCVRRHQERRLSRGRSGQPAGGLRREQGGRRARGARGAARARHPAHRLGLQRARTQFRQDDAAPCRASARCCGSSPTRPARRPARPTLPARSR